MDTASSATARETTPSEPRASPFLTRLQEAAERQGYAKAAAEGIAGWCRQFILFHGKRHPQEMGLAEGAAFLDHVARTHPDALRAIAAARAALEFVYETYLHRQPVPLPWPRPPRLLDQVMQAMRVKHYARTTESCYVQWIRRFILFHGKRHPRDLGAAEINRELRGKSN